MYVSDCDGYVFGPMSIFYTEMHQKFMVKNKKKRIESPTTNIITAQLVESWVCY